MNANGQAKVNLAEILVSVPTEEPRRSQYQLLLHILRLSAILRDGMLFTPNDGRVPNDEITRVSLHNAGVLEQKMQDPDVLKLLTELGIQPVKTA